MIFIYNANSDASSKLFDFAHKVINPSTYSCNLCKLTHHNLGERDTWKRFVQEQEVEMVFFHKDEWSRETNSQEYEYPIILDELKGTYTIVIDKSQLDLFENEMALIEYLKKYLEEK